MLCQIFLIEKINNNMGKGDHSQRKEKKKPKKEGSKSSKKGKGRKNA